MSQTVSAKRKKHTPPVSSLDGDAVVLRRSLESRNHLQDLLERSDQKAGFVVTGIAFLGLFCSKVTF